MKRATRYSKRDVRRALRHYETLLQAHPNVLRVGIGERIQKGERKGTLAIRVVVSTKWRKRLPGALPRSVRGIRPDGRPAAYRIPVDVVRGLPLRLFSLCGGSRISRIHKGACALVYRSESKRDLLLTNAHVVARPVERAAHQSVRAEGAGAIGAVHRLTPYRSGVENRMDAALVWLDEGVAAQPLHLLGEPSPIVRTEALRELSGATYFYVDSQGRRKLFAQPDDFEGAHAFEVGANLLSYAGFWTLRHQGGPRPGPGDSGSLLCRRIPSGLAACGLVFGGTQRSVAVYPIERALELLSRAEASIHGQTERVGIAFA